MPSGVFDPVSEKISVLFLLRLRRIIRQRNLHVKLFFPMVRILCRTEHRQRDGIAGLELAQLVNKFIHGLHTHTVDRCDQILFSDIRCQQRTVCADIRDHHALRNVFQLRFIQIAGRSFNTDHGAVADVTVFDQLVNDLRHLVAGDRKAHALVIGRNDLGGVHPDHLTALVDESAA